MPTATFLKSVGMDDCSYRWRKRVLSDKMRQHFGRSRQRASSNNPCKGLRGPLGSVVGRTLGSPSFSFIYRQCFKSVEPFMTRSLLERMLRFPSTLTMLTRPKRASSTSNFIMRMTGSKILIPGKRQNTSNFTLNYGLTDRIELGINAPILRIVNTRESLLGSPSGIGDTQLGVKVRLHDQREGSRLPAMSVVFYVEVPTGSTRKQTGSGLTDY